MRSLWWCLKIWKERNEWEMGNAKAGRGGFLVSGINSCNFYTDLSAQRAYSGGYNDIERRKWEMLRQGTGGFLVLSYFILRLGVETIREKHQNRHHANYRVKFRPITDME